MDDTTKEYGPTLVAAISTVAIISVLYAILSGPLHSTVEAIFSRLL